MLKITGNVSTVKLNTWNYLQMLISDYLETRLFSLCARCSTPAPDTALLSLPTTQHLGMQGGTQTYISSSLLLIKRDQLSSAFRFFTGTFQESSAGKGNPHERHD